VGMVQMFDQTGAVEIAELQIQPSHQNRGIGGRVLTDIVDQAHKRGKTVTLSVALKNEHGIRVLSTPRLSASVGE